MATPVPPAAAPAPAPAHPSRVPWIITAVVVVLALVAGVVVFVVLRSDEAAAGEIFLEPATEVGEDPFGGDLIGTAISPSQATASPVGSVTTAASTTTTAPGAVVATPSISGGARGLYGGSLNQAVCDPVQQANWLESHPDVAAAFAQALNADPTLRWSGGTQVQVSQLRAYITELTAVTLTGDTRVTNHGYANGKPTARQAVLQAGTAVMVDRYGVPRIKCNCGNPLTPPTPVKTTPTYRGPQWPTFSPTTVVVVTEVNVQIDVYVLSDLEGNGEIERPAGTTGGEDVSIPAGTTGTTQRPPSSTSSTAPTSSTTQTTPTSSIPAGGDQAAYCTRFRELLEQYRDIDPSVPEVVSIWAELTALAPPDIKPAMQTVQTAIEQAAASGSSELDVSNAPEVETALYAVIAYLQGTCGINPSDY